MTERPLWISAVLIALGTGLALLAVGPAVWLLFLALQPADADIGTVGGRLTLAHFAAAWEQGRLARPLVNSVIVTVARTALVVVLSALAAYPLARMRFPARDAIFVLILATMMIPEQVIVVPVFRTIVAMGLWDTLPAVVLPFAVNAFGIFLCRQAFLAVPASLEEAARLDGATSLQIWRHVMLPLAAPSLATLAVFTVIGSWSDLLWPLIVLDSRENATLPVAINELLGVFSTNIRAAYAASVIALIPVLLVYVFAQRWLTPNLLAGSVKG